MTEINSPQKQKPSSLEVIQKGIIIPAPSEGLDLKEEFRKSAQHVPFWISNTFKTCFEGSMKSNKIKEVVLDKARLKDITTNEDILSQIKTLLSKEEILYRLSYFTRSEFKDKPSLLHNETKNRVTIIGYLNYHGGEYVAYVNWDSWDDMCWCDIQGAIGQHAVNSSVFLPSGILTS